MKTSVTSELYNKYSVILSECLLFRGFTPAEISDSLEKASCRIVSLKKNEVLSLPEKLQDIIIALSGRFNVIQDSGMNASLAHNLIPGRCFGIAFCAESIPCSHFLQAAEHGELMRLSYQGLLSQEALCPRILENLLAITSQNLRVLAEKIGHTQSRSVRAKLSVFLRDQVEHKGCKSFIMDMNRKDMADYLNITYPAMLRELSKMQKEGILMLEGNRITIPDLETLIENGSEYNIL